MLNWIWHTWNNLNPNFDVSVTVVLFSLIPIKVTKQYISSCFRGDLYEDEEIQSMLKYKPPWVEEYKQICNNTPVESAGESPLMYVNVNQRHRLCHLISSPFWNPLQLRNVKCEILVKQTDWSILQILCASNKAEKLCHDLGNQVLSDSFSLSVCFFLKKKKSQGIEITATSALFASLLLSLSSSVRLMTDEHWLSLVVLLFCPAEK